MAEGDSEEVEAAETEQGETIRMGIEVDIEEATADLEARNAEEEAVILGLEEVVVGEEADQGNEVKEEDAVKIKLLDEEKEEAKIFEVAKEDPVQEVAGEEEVALILPNLWQMAIQSKRFIKHLETEENLVIILTY